TIAPEVALILVLPWASVFAKPALLTVAIVGCDEFHVTVLVKFCWLPSVYVPVALNCWVLPLGIDGFVGVTAIELSAIAVTDNEVFRGLSLPVSVTLMLPVPV